MTTKTQEQLDAEDLQKRVQGFNAELIPLLKKYRVGLAAIAFISPDGRIGAQPQLVDDKTPIEEGEKTEEKVEEKSALSEG